MSISTKIAALCSLALLSAPAVAAADDTPHLHDGFYLRLALGAGYLSDSASLKFGSVSQDYTLSGSGLALDILLGGTPAPGLVIGGGFQSASFGSPTLKSGDLSIDVSNRIVYSTIGPFVDYYPNPADGLHFQGFIGFATLSAQDNNGRTSSKNPTGFGASVGVGYEWFVSNSWSIGILGRVQYGSLKVSDSGVEETDKVLLPALLATFTYH
jgi:opacity protein-like surface antigen